MPSSDNAELSVSIDAGDTQKVLEQLNRGLVDIDKNADKAGQSSGDMADGFSKSEKAAQTFGDKVAQVKDGLIAMGAGIAALVKTFGDWVSANNESEQSSKRLEIALKNSGEYTQEAMDGFIALADTLSKTTGADDDYIVSQIALAKQMGISNANMKDTITLALDLSKAYGIDMTTALKGIAQLQEGQVGILGRYNPQLRTMAENGATGAEMLKVLSGSVAGTAQAMEEATGGAGRLATNFGNFGELIGKTLKPIFDFFIKQINNLFDWFNNLSEPVKTIVAGIVAFGAGLGSFSLIAVGAVAVVTGLQGAFAALGVTMGLAAAPIMPILLAVGALAGGFVALTVVLNEMQPPSEKLAKVNTELEQVNAKLADTTNTLTEEERKNLVQRQGELIKASQEYTAQVEKQRQSVLEYAKNLSSIKKSSDDVISAQKELANVKYMATYEQIAKLSDNARGYLEKYGVSLKNAKGETVGLMLESNNAFFTIANEAQNKMKTTSDAIKKAIDEGVVKAEEIAPLIGENLVNGSFPISALNEYGQKARNAIYEWIYSGAIDSAKTLEELDNGIITQIDRIGKYYDKLIDEASKSAAQLGIPVLQTLKKLNIDIAKAEGEAKRIEITKASTSGYSGDTKQFKSGSKTTITEEPKQIENETVTAINTVSKAEEKRATAEIDRQIRLNRILQENLTIKAKEGDVMAGLMLTEARSKEIDLLKERKELLTDSIDIAESDNEILKKSIDLENDKGRSFAGLVKNGIAALDNQKEITKETQKGMTYQERFSIWAKKTGEEMEKSKAQAKELADNVASGLNVLESFVSDLASGNGFGQAFGNLTDNLLSTFGKFLPGGEITASIISSVVGIASSIFDSVVNQEANKMKELSKLASMDAQIAQNKGDRKAELEAYVAQASADLIAAQKKYGNWSDWDVFWTGVSKEEAAKNIELAGSKLAATMQDVEDYTREQQKISDDEYWDKVKAEEEAEIKRQEEITAELEKQKDLTNDKLNSLIKMGGLDVQNIADIQKIQQTLSASGYSGVDLLSQMSNLGVAGSDYSRSIGQLTVNTTVNGASLNDYMRSLGDSVSKAISGS